MAKGTAIKITKLYGQTTTHVDNLGETVQDITGAGDVIVSILQRSEPNTFEVLYVATKREEVEVDIPDEIEALDQADGSAI